MTVVLLAGNPNAGKTTLFNRLTGARAKVANYPGVTVDRRESSLTLPRSGAVTCVDLPGTYSLTSRSAEEEVAVDAILGVGQPPPSAVIVAVDSTALARNLYLATQIIDAGVPVVLALTMTDEARASGIQIDHAALAERLGVAVVPIVAPRGEGIDDLLLAVEDALSQERATRVPVPRDEVVERALAAVESRLAELQLGATDAARRALAEWTILSFDAEGLMHLTPAARDAARDARRDAEADGVDLDRELVTQRYRRIDEIVAATVVESSPDRSRWTDRIDAVLTHPYAGTAIFLVVMAILFETLFAWSDPMIGVIEDVVSATQGAVGGLLPEGPFRGLVVDGVLGGVGNTIVFVPQIALLFVFITFLEDSGYLARVAFVIDRLMGGVGLHGKAFVPMLSGFACAIPAVLATRTMESRRDRLITMLAIPLTSCSARLPVYVLVTAAVFDPSSRVLGIFTTGSIVLLAMYTLSIVAALTAAAVLRRTVLRGPRPTLVLELPPYRVPMPRNIIRATWARVRRFLVDAGTIILAMTILLWALLSFPKDAEVETRYEALRAEVAYEVPPELQEERLGELAGEEAGEQLRYSLAGRLGRAVEPVLEPLGFDWRLGIGIIGAFAAREVFVSTLGVVFGISEADETSDPLRDRLRAATWPDGRPLLTPLSGMSLMVFFVLACQCMSTIAAVRRESGSWRWPLLLLGYMSALAYVASLLVYQVGKLVGIGQA